MNRSYFAAWTLVISILVSGCQTPIESSQSPIGPSSSRNSDAIKKYQVQIISEPPGAVVEVNSNHIGKTPLTIDLEGWEETRTFARNHIIVAHPVQSGGYTQVKSFVGWSRPSRTYGNPIPEKIYFNMSLVPSPSRHDIRINK